MFELKSMGLPGCYEIRPSIFKDERGRFIKVFHSHEFAEHGLETNFTEEYYSVSKYQVIRGMHFQTPPEDYVKLVYCIEGSVFDAVVDLRMGSPTFGCYDTVILNADQGNIIYLPQGIAHGFCSLSQKSIVVYKVTTVYSPSNDKGVRWDSMGIPWPVKEPIISRRDKSFPALADFQSPFSYDS